MKRHRVFACAVLFFLMAFGAALLWARFTLLPKAEDLIRTGANEKINGTFSFAYMDMSLTGELILTDVAVKDETGREVLETEEARISVSPVRAFSAWKDDADITAAVNSINVERPVVHVWQDGRTQAWNVTKILKKQADSKSLSLRSLIFVHDGIVQAALAESKMLILDGVNGSVSLQDYPTTKADFDGTVDGKPVSAHVSYTSQRQYDVKVRGEEVDITYGAPFAASVSGLQLTGGKVKDILLHVTQSHRGFTAEGRLDVADGSLVYEGYTVDSLNGHIGIGDDTVKPENVTGHLNGQPFSLSGTVKTDTGNPVFNLDVKIKDADLGALAQGKDFSLAGRAGYDGKVWGTADDINLNGKVTVSDLDYDGWHIDSAKADVVYAHHMGTVTGGQASFCGGTITAVGTWNTDSGAFTGKADVEDVRLEEVPQVPAGLSGFVSGELFFAGTSADMSSVTARGRIGGAALSYDGIALERASADFLCGGDIMTLTDIRGDVRGGTVTGAVTYNGETGEKDGSLIMTDIPLDLFNRFADLSLDGTASAVIFFNGVEPQWTAEFDGRDGNVNGMGFDNIYGSLHGTGRAFTVNSLTYRYKDGTHSVRGTADLDSRAVDLTVDTKHCRLEQILIAAGRTDAGLTGWADNSARISGTIDNPVVTGTATLTNGSAKGYLYKRVYVNYLYHDAAVCMTDGTIEAYDALLHFSGSAGEHLDLDVEGTNLETDRIVRSEDNAVSGALNVKAHIGGTPQSPAVGGSLRAASLTVNKILLTDATGDFSYGDGILRLHRFGFKQGDGTYEAELMHNAKNGRIIGRAAVHAGDLANVITLAKLPLKNITGQLDGSIAVDGTTENPSLRVTGKITSGTVGGRVMEPSDVDVAVEDGVIKVNSLALTVDGGLLAAQGTYALHGPVNIQVAAKNFSTAILQNVSGADSVPVDSRADFALNLSGSGDDPVAEGSVQLNGGTLNGVSFTEAFALFTVKEGIITLNQATLSRDPYKATAAGTIPLAALRDDMRDGAVNVRVKLDKAGLDGLTFITPVVEKADGAMAGNIVITGTVQNPRLDGSVTVRNGYIKLRDVANPLANVNGDLLFKGNEAVLSSHGTMDKTGKDDKGFYDLQGSAAWTGTTLDAYTATLTAHDLNVDCEYYKGPVNGSFTVAKNGNLPKVSGSLDINNATVSIPLTLALAESDFDCDLDVAVRAGNKVRFYDSGLYDVWITGEAAFAGSLSAPDATGHFEVTRGNIRYFDTRFNINRGRADFKGNSFLPQVDMDADTRIGQYTVMLNLTGRADNMDMTLRSDPPLTKAQIVSLITLRNSNKRDSSLNREDVNSLIGSGIRFTLNSLGLTQKLEDVLSLDMLTITTGDLDLTAHTTSESKNYYNIEMGKYLFNNFMLTAAFGLNHNDNRVGMQYNLGSRFSVDTWKSPDNVYIGGSYRYTF